MMIVGAGLSGLIAAHAFPQARLVERERAPAAAHAALLRFRSNAVSQLVGIPFREVEVRKGIWFDSAFRAPDIRLANWYSQKVIGRFADRSVWNLKAANRFIAPEDFYDQLVAAVGSRVTYNFSAGPDFYKASSDEPLINTAPLPEVLSAINIQTSLSFDRSPIVVARFRVPDCDVFQTIYFPDPETPVYRASITSDLLIVESRQKSTEHMFDIEDVAAAFGLDVSELQPVGTVSQRYGKIAPIDDGARKHLLFRLTHEHNIYSIGRYAIWKNILLDDVVQDLLRVRTMIRSRNAYDLHSQLGEPS